MEDVKGYFSYEELLQKCAYKKNRKTTGKDRETGVLADRRYLVAKPEEKVDGLKSIVPTRNTITEADGKEAVDERYFISSLPTDIEKIQRAVRGHWMIESYHWH